jgi:hypothetical protein
MTTKERLHELVDGLSDAEADEALEYIASRGNGGGDDSAEAEISQSQSGRDFLISVADGASGLDLDQLRTVRDRAWR